jgi:hypothetical protein
MVCTGFKTRFQDTADLVRDILIEDTRAFDEVLGDGDEAVHVAPRIHTGVGVRLHGRFVHYLLVGEFGGDGAITAPTHPNHCDTFTHRSAP